MIISVVPLILFMVLVGVTLLGGRLLSAESKDEGSRIGDDTNGAGAERNLRKCGRTLITRSSLYL